MQQRIITAIFFVAVMLLGIFGSSFSFFVLFTMIGLGGIWELSALFFSEKDTNRLGRRIFALFIGIFPLLIFIQGYYMQGQLPEQIIDFRLILGMFSALLLLELFLEDERPFTAFGHNLVGLFYVGLPLVCLVSIAFHGGAYDPWRVFGILALIWINDTFAYLTGRFIGKTPFWPRHSPKKTWEGTLGGFVFTVLLAYGLSHYFSNYTPAEWLRIGAIVAVLGGLGDLVQSMLKRSYGVKDTGNFLPGHGGFLDRFDSFLFVLPFIYVALLF